MKAAKYWFKTILIGVIISVVWGISSILIKEDTNWHSDILGILLIYSSGIIVGLNYKPSKNA